MAARKFLVPIDLSQLELQNAAIQNLASAPSTPVKGQLYYDTGANTLYWWNGTAWVAASPGSGFPGYGAVVTQTSFGAASTSGVATTVPRSDHAHGTPTHVAADHSAIPLSALAAASAAVNMGNQLINNVASPVSATDGANKSYVDALIQGLDWKNSARVATTVAGTLASSFANGQTVDGIVLATGDRLLIKNQAAGAENGVYTVNAAGAPTRALDADAATELVNAAVFVELGTTNADTGWVCTNDTVTLGTTALTFVQFTGAQAIVAGAGLASTGNTLNVGGTIGITVNADDVQVNRGAANGRVPLLYASTITGTGAATSFAVSHNLSLANSTDLVAMVLDLATLAVVDVDMVATSANTLTVNFAVAPANGKTYRAVVYG